MVSEITAAVASLEDTTPDTLPPLHEVIDMEALKHLFRETHGHLTFEYLEYEMTASHDYSVEFCPRDRALRLPASPSRRFLRPVSAESSSDWCA